MKEVEIKKTIKVDMKKIITELVENGTINGISRAREITPEASDEFIKDHIVINIMKQLSNYIEWNS